MLITSRETGRWVLPKGWAENDLTGAQLATKEAFEEAGIVGHAGSEPIGAYHYTKRLPDGEAVECLVEVFPLQVTQQLDVWPEAKQRRRAWFTLAQAAMLVAESELVTMLLRVAVSGELLPHAA